MKTSKDIGNRMRELRQRAHLSQVEIGDLLGVTFQQIQKYESGKNNLSTDKFIRFCRLLGATPNYFFKKESASIEAALLKKLQMEKWNYQGVMYDLETLVRVARTKDADTLQDFLDRNYPRKYDD